MIRLEKTLPWWLIELVHCDVLSQFEKSGGAVASPRLTKDRGGALQERKGARFAPRGPRVTRADPSESPPASCMESLLSKAIKTASGWRKDFYLQFCLFLAHF